MSRPPWQAFTLAPLAAPVVYVLFMLAFVPDPTPKHDRTWEMVLLTLTFGFIPASYLASLVLGVPLLYLLWRLQKFTFWRLLMLSAPAGALAGVALLGVTIHFGATVAWDRVRWDSVALFLASGAVLGMANGAAFCVLAGLLPARKRRP